MRVGCAILRDRLKGKPIPARLFIFAMAGRKVTLSIGDLDQNTPARGPMIPASLGARRSRATRSPLAPSAIQRGSQNETIAVEALKPFSTEGGTGYGDAY
jgi:hypothetical protein